MKTSILSTIATISLSAVLGPVSLRAQGTIHVTIPFDFTVGAKSFAAGEYRVNQQAPHVLAIRSINGRSVMMIGANAAQATAPPGKAMLTFTKYGDHYFLSQVSDYGHGWELPKSTVEKELAAQRPSPKTVSVSGGDQ